MTAFVKSVEYVEITLTGSTAVSVNLTKSQTIANCIPIISINADSNVADIIDRRFAEVFFEAGPKVTAQRDGSTGTIIVGVFVVEIDTSGDVSVEQGTWDLLTSETATTEAITSVTTTKAFCIISYRHASTANGWNEAAVAVKFNSGTELSFDRTTATGAVTGRYYVVKTSGTDFAVDHQSMSIINTAETTTISISSVTENKTFVYNTFLSSETADDIRDAGLIIDLQDATTVRGRRAFDSFGGSSGASNSTMTIEIQVISAVGTEFSVERNELDHGDSLTKAVTITEIDQTKAIVVPGGYQGNTSANETGGGDLPGNYAILDFTSDTEVTGTKAHNPTPDGTTFFEVVEFVLAAAAAIEAGPILQFAPSWSRRHTVT